LCGIAGYYNPDISDADGPALLTRMIDRLRHRGPDGSGIDVKSSIGLGHARLSIIDLVSGGQPMSNGDGSITISFNGEIFNYIELRDVIRQRGGELRTTSDTEVILLLYEHFGSDCVTMLNGDFAFAIRDLRNRTLFLARDRIGVRPLFYTQRGNGLAFASEMKSLLEVPGVSRELDLIALDQIFTFWFPLAPNTIFKDIKELPPGHILIAKDGAVKIHRYWELSYPETQDPRAGSTGSESELIETFRELFLDATKIRLRADVPVGAYLSGGIDSAGVTAVARHLNANSLRTFSIAFEDAEYNEAAFQREISAALGTDHTSTICRASDIASIFPDVIYHAETPILRPAPAPMMSLSRLVRECGYKVVLSGEGADEVFAGYDIFAEAQLRRFCARQPQSHVRPLLFRRLYTYLPKLQTQPISYLQAFFNAGDPRDPLYSHIPRIRSTTGIKSFFSAEMKKEIAGYDAIDDLRSRLPAAFRKWHPLSQTQYLESTYLLPSYILSSQGDRMAMANAVESRFPYLDPRIVEFGANLPANFKLRGMRTKYILRRSFEDTLPKSITTRPKQPYRAPETEPFVNSGRPPYVDALMAESRISETGFFNPAAVKRLMEKAANASSLGARDQMAFVGILSTQIWNQSFSSR
jgi:asparagine synthase (glutamine-hydrolysing)